MWYICQICRSLVNLIRLRAFDVISWSNLLCLQSHASHISQPHDSCSGLTSWKYTSPRREVSFCELATPARLCPALPCSWADGTLVWTRRDGDGDWTGTGTGDGAHRVTRPANSHWVTGQRPTGPPRGRHKALLLERGWGWGAEQRNRRAQSAWVITPRWLVTEQWSLTCKLRISSCMYFMYFQSSAPQLQTKIIRTVPISRHRVCLTTNAV